MTPIAESAYKGALNPLSISQIVVLKFWTWLAGNAAAALEDYAPKDFSSKGTFSGFF